MDVDLTKELRDLVGTLRRRRLYRSAEMVEKTIAEMERLREIEARLPKTADGVRVCPGDEAYLIGEYGWPDLDDGSIGPCRATGEPGEKLVLSLGALHGYEDYAYASEMYSTPKAAVKAAKEYAKRSNAEDAADD